MDRAIKNNIYKMKLNRCFLYPASTLGYRAALLQRIASLRYGDLFIHNTPDANALNIVALRQLIIDNLGDQVEGNDIIEANSRYIIDWLTGDHNVQFQFNFSKDNLVESEYEYAFNRYSIFFNTLSTDPLYIRKTRHVDIYIKEPCPGIFDEFLEDFIKNFTTQFLLEEPLYINMGGAIAQKSFILEQYSGVSLDGANQELINDAYAELIRVSSLDLDESIDKRKEYLTQYRGRFSTNLRKCVLLGIYYNNPPDFEVDAYQELIKEANKALLSVEKAYQEKRKLPYDIPEYYVHSQKPSEYNKLKVEEGFIRSEVIRQLSYNRQISSKINDVNMDILLSIVIYLFHINLLGLNIYTPSSPTSEYFRIITDSFYQDKPILIKFILKNSLDPLLHDLKERGMISMHQLENFFGYRVTATIIDEVKKDYMAWFNEDIKGYEDIQYNWVKKWGTEFLDSLNYKGRSVRQIMCQNISRYRNANEILGSVLSYMHSKGAVDDEKVRVVGGKRRGISKNNYFNLIESQGDYKIRGNRRNKVIIKREEYIKQRIVINSSLDTFVPLSKINKVLSVLSAGTGIMYFSNTKMQKAEHYPRLSKYLLYNKYVKRRYLCMPLDYSSYDHTITLKLIQGVLEILAEQFKLPELIQWFNQFKKILMREPIYFKEMEGMPENNQYYRYGVLSGWKITSSIESIGNAIVTYGVIRSLGLELVDLETMGDDLIIILDKPELSRLDQIQLLTQVCDRYKKMGFKMNVPKNSIGYNFLEFLRVTFRPGIIQCYPSRIISACFVVKPGKSVQNFGADELLGVINKVMKRYGARSRIEEIASYVVRGFKKQDIRNNFVGYCMRPQDYEVVRDRHVEFEYDVDLENTPIFRRYMYIFGQQFKSIIATVIRRDVIQQSKVRTKLIKKRRSGGKLLDWQKSILVKAVSRYGKKATAGREPYLSLPEYHQSTILERILRRSHFGTVEMAKNYLVGVFARNYDLKMIRHGEMVANLQLVKECKDILQLRSIINLDKIGVQENNIPAIILSRYKESLRKGLFIIAKEVYNQYEYDFIMSILRGNKDKLLRQYISRLMSVRCETISVYSGMPLVTLAD